MAQISPFSIEKVKSYLEDFRVFARECEQVRDHATALIVPFEMRAAMSSALRLAAVSAC